MTAQILREPDDDRPSLYVDNAALAVAFSAGRRGADSIDCITCGTPIHQHILDDQPNDPALPWFDGHGSANGYDFRTRERHDHAPGRETGPTYGPFRYVEMTYNSIRVTDGNVLAFFDAARGDWVLDDFAGKYAGEAYSDATVYSTKETT